MEGASTVADEPLSLSLRPSPKQDPNAKSLPNLLQRIIQQKGHFRNVTEKSLQTEIRALEASNNGLANARIEGSDDGEDTRKKDAPRLDEGVVATREEILKEAGQAYLEAFHALDFVSLLLSKEMPRQAEISMSQHLKQHVPLGSLGMEKVQVDPESETTLKDLELVSRGWKLNSLTLAADSLLNAAKRLEKEVEREGTYWDQALAISQKGWSVCRMPQEKHMLGVRFGFREAAPEFRERGLAALRYGEDGKMTLDQGSGRSMAKGIRVRFTDQHKSTIGSSSLRPAADTDAPIEQLVLQARNSIYDEELFREMNREALTLANQGITHRHSTLILALPDQQILVDLVPLDTQEPTPSNTSFHDVLADSIAMAFRLLLGHAHSQSYKRRTQIPAPISENKPPRPPYSILRPVLTHLFHQHETRALRLYFERLVAPLRRAQLQAELTLFIGAEPSLQHPSLAEATKGPMNPDRVVEAFARGADSSFNLTLPGTKQVAITVRTQLDPPTLGTEYVVEPKGNFSADYADGSRTADDLVAPQTRFDSEKEMKSYIQHLVTMSIMTEVMRWVREAGTANVDGQENGTVGTSPRAKALVQAVSFNDLIITSPKTGQSRRVRILLSEQGLEMRWGSGSGAAGKAQGRMVWKSEGEDEERPLREIVEMVGELR